MAESGARKRILEKVEAVEQQTVTKIQKVSAVTATVLPDDQPSCSYKNNTVLKEVTETRHSDVQIHLSQKQLQTFTADEGSSLAKLQQSNKYKKAFQRLYEVIPYHLRNPDDLANKLFSKEVLLHSELKLLRKTLQFETEERHNQELIDIMIHKSEHDIKQFLEVLESMDQHDIADCILEEAAKAENERSSVIFSSRQVANVIGQTNPQLGHAVSLELQQMLQEEAKEKKDINLRIETMSLPDFHDFKGETHVGKSGHLLLSLKFIQGSKKVTQFIKHNVFKMKSKLTKALNIPCSCHIEDARRQTSSTEEEEECNALISIGFKQGEREAFQIFESNLLDFENYLCEQTSSIISITEECIKIKVRVHDQEHFLELQREIQNGNLIKRISDWLESKGYKPQGTNALLLIVDDNEMERARLEIPVTNKDVSDILPFPISYTFCPDKNQWFWSGDRLHWFAVNIKIVQAGRYKSMKPSRADAMILEELENKRIKPPNIQNYCLICSNQDHELLRSTAKRNKVDRDVVQEFRRADWRCATCTTNISQQTLNHHLENKQENAHVLHRLDCLYHNDQKISLYCLDCEKYICNMCRDEAHVNHRHCLYTNVPRGHRRYHNEATTHVVTQSSTREKMLFFFIPLITILLTSITVSHWYYIALHNSWLLKEFYVNNDVWIPNPENQSLLILSENRMKSRVITFPDHLYLYPRAVFQISKTEVLLASDWGLFLLNLDGEIQHLISEGKYNDVFIDKNGKILVHDYYSKTEISVRCLRQQHSSTRYAEIFKLINYKGTGNLIHKTIYEVFDTTLNMAVVENTLWIPKMIKSSIQIIPLHGGKPYTIPIKGVRPTSVHQGCHGEVLIASKEGIFVKEIRTANFYMVMTGDFTHISAEGNQAVALESNKRRIIILSFSNLRWHPLKSLDLEYNFVEEYLNEKYSKTLHLHRGIIYFSSEYDSVIRIFSITGRFIETLNIHGITLPGHSFLTRVCGTDSSGSLLVCDVYNDSFRIYKKGQWKIYKLQGITEPRDVHIVGDKMYVLWKSTGDSYKVTEFSAQNPVKVINVDMP